MVLITIWNSPKIAPLNWGYPIRMKKSISIVLLVTILLQSCVAYQKTSVSLNEAHDSKGMVKVTDTRGESFVFNYIELRDSIYYGTNKEVTIRLETSQITGIYLKDNNKSKTQTVIFWISFSVLLVAGMMALFVGMLKALEDEVK